MYLLYSMFPSVARSTKIPRPKKPKTAVPKKVKNQTKFQKKPCPSGKTVCTCKK